MSAALDSPGLGGSGLDSTQIVDYLYARGQLDRPRVTSLTGGVSAETVLVEESSARVVVKRALDRLLVVGDWTAKPERAMSEAAAIELLHKLTPEYTPQLLDADPARNVIVMSAAPADWLPWKTVLLGEAADPTSGVVSTAATLGAVLGIWHDQTWHDQAVADRFDDYEAFDQLRVSPFHRVVAAANPSAALRIEECADELMTRRDCLVHGDFSPKNVLVGADGLMVLDFEVAHVGAAVFDLAFMSAHLVLKALHLSQRAAELASSAAAFLRAYGTATAQVGREPVQRLGWHTACLLLARVDGLSPAGYLNPETAVTVRGLALELLAADDPTSAQVWDRVMDAAQ